MLVYRPLTDPAVDPTAVVALLVEVFTPRGDELTLVQQWREDPSRRVLLALDDAVAVALLIVRMLEPGDPETYGAPFGVDLASRVEARRRGVFQLLAVRPGWRRRRIATALARDQLAWLVAQGVRIGIGVSWDHGGFGTAGSSRPMFEAAGFAAVGTSATFFRALHEATGQVCPRCEPEPCACNAILFVRDPLGE